MVMLVTSVAGCYRKSVLLKDSHHPSSLCPARCYAVAQQCKLHARIQKQCHSVGLHVCRCVQQQTFSNYHSVGLLVCRCVQLEAEKASKEHILQTVLTQLEEQGTTLAISQEAEGQLRAQLHTLTESCATLEAQVQSVTEGSAALQARYATLEIQAAKVKFNYQKVLVFMLSFKRPPPPPFPHLGTQCLSMTQLCWQSC